MSRSFEDRVAFITGASSGIGAATAREFVRQGAKVALLARRVDKLDAVKREIEQMGGECLVIAADVRDRASLDAAVRQTVERFGRIDVALANAGYGVQGDTIKLTTDDFRSQYDTNVFGVIDTTYAVLPELLKSKGRLGIVSSIMGFMSAPAMAPYCSSKFAVLGFAESIYYDLLPRGVAVTCLKPGVVESEIRSVNNSGVYTGKPDPAPGWITQSSGAAAREICRALYRRKPEHTVTGHGKVMGFVVRHFPRTTRFAFRMGTRGKFMPPGVEA